MFSKPGAYEATKMTKKNISQKIESDDTKMEVSYVVCVFVCVSVCVFVSVCLSA